MIRRSKRPGLNSAGSSTSGRFVAARTRSPLFVSNPSISARSWFNVCSRSSLPPPPSALSRLLPIASISSINTIHGAICCACLNRSRTREAPTPTYISTNADPDKEKNGTFASPATAFARSVLPVPGGPTRSAPFGSFAPMPVYFPGLCRKSTTSCKDSFASSSPATSKNVTPVCFSIYILALLLPIPIMPPPLDIFFIRKLNMNTRSTIGRITVMKISMISELAVSGIWDLNSTPALSKRFTSVSSDTFPV